MAKAKRSPIRDQLKKEAARYADIIWSAYQQREREGGGIQKKELAYYTGSHPSGMSRMLRGRAVWPVERYVAALEYLEIPIAEVFGETRKTEKGETKQMATVIRLVKKMEDPDTVVEILDKIRTMEQSDPDAATKILSAIVAIEAIIKNKAKTKHCQTKPQVHSIAISR